MGKTIVSVDVNAHVEILIELQSLRIQSRQEVLIIPISRFLVEYISDILEEKLFLRLEAFLNVRALSDEVDINLHVLHHEPPEWCSEHVVWLDQSSQFSCNHIAILSLLIEHEEDYQGKLGVVCKHELGLERDDPLGALALDVDEYVDWPTDADELTVFLIMIQNGFISLICVNRLL